VQHYYRQARDKQAPVHPPPPPARRCQQFLRRTAPRGPQRTTGGDPDAAHENPADFGRRGSVTLSNACRSRVSPRPVSLPHFWLGVKAVARSGDRGAPMAENQQKLAVGTALGHGGKPPPREPTILKVRPYRNPAGPSSDILTSRCRPAFSITAAS
jgi:hypothetical protein